MSGRIENRLKELRSLPALQPPANLEAATLDAMTRASTAQRPRPMLMAAAWAAVIGAAALLAVLATDPGPADDPVAMETDLLVQELAAQSVYLERMLVSLPQRRIMRVSTAGTIAGLEDQIVLIDAELYRASMEAEPPEYRAALLRERNDVMNALVNVRYAQSVAFNY